MHGVLVFIVTGLKSGGVQVGAIQSTSAIHRCPCTTSIGCSIQRREQGIGHEGITKHHLTCKPGIGSCIDGHVEHSAGVRAKRIARQGVGILTCCERGRVQCAIERSRGSSPRSADTGCTAKFIEEHHGRSVVAQDQGFSGTWVGVIHGGDEHSGLHRSAPGINDGINESALPIWRKKGGVQQTARQQGTSASRIGPSAAFIGVTTEGVEQGEVGERAADRQGVILPGIGATAHLHGNDAYRVGAGCLCHHGVFELEGAIPSHRWVEHITGERVRKVEVGPYTAGLRATSQRFEKVHLGLCCARLNSGTSTCVRRDRAVHGQPSRIVGTGLSTEDHIGVDSSIIRGGIEELAVYGAATVVPSSTLLGQSSELPAHIERGVGGAYGNGPVIARVGRKRFCHGDDGHIGRAGQLTGYAIDVVAGGIHGRIVDSGDVHQVQGPCATRLSVGT